MKKFSAVLLVLAVFWIDSTLQQGNKKKSVLAEIEGLGRISGKEIQSRWTNQKIFQFFDIKYGESPSGENRFKPALPVKPWEGVRNAMNPRRGCPSLQDMKAIKRSEGNRDVENCLFLTISTKDFDAKTPVMVYLHGEFLYEGTSLEASPEYLLEKNIVLVSVRYRLAPFGFLSTMTDDIPGNAGFTDVILALQWIQKYIHEFGGDPTRVTLFGQVGGAALANLLTISPIVPENLFHRVIYQSGSIMTPTFITETPLKFTQDIAKRGGCTNVENITMLNDCLINISASKLLDGFSKHGIANAQKGIGSFGGVQFVIGGPSGVLPDHPATLISEGKMRYYPTIGGVTKNAGTFLLREIFQDDYNERIPDKKNNASTYIDYMIKHTNGGDPSGAWQRFANNDFFNEEEIKNGTFVGMLSGLIDMCGTIPFKNPILLALQANAKKLPNDTYLYTFDYYGEHNRYNNDEETDVPNLPFDMGVSLTDENVYLFPWPSHAANLNRRDTRIARRMTSLWTSFAARGIPKANALPTWPPMNQSTGPYMKINYNSTVGLNFLDEYTITTKEARKGQSLLVEEYFHKPNEDEDEEDEDEDYDYRQ